MLALPSRSCVFSAWHTLMPPLLQRASQCRVLQQTITTHCCCTPTSLHWQIWALLSSAVAHLAVAACSFHPPPPASPHLHARPDPRSRRPTPRLKSPCNGTGPSCASRHSAAQHGRSLQQDCISDAAAQCSSSGTTLRLEGQERRRPPLSPCNGLASLLFPGNGTLVPHLSLTPT